MSKAQLDEFVTVIRATPALLQQFSSLGSDPPAMVRRMVEAGHERGYDFTYEEGRDWYMQCAQVGADGQLGDAALDAVAGGAMPRSSSGGGQSLAFPNVCKVSVFW